MNSVVMSGRLVRDPELRHTPSGVAVCNMRIAVDRAGQQDDDGQPGPGYFDVTAWNRQAENSAQYLTQGSRIGVTGELRFREWEPKDGGSKRNAVEISAFRVEFLDTKAEREAREARDNGDQGSFGGAGNEYVPAGASPDFGGSSDDDIPF